MHEARASWRGSNDRDVLKVRALSVFLPPILPPYIAMVLEAVVLFKECTREQALTYRRTAYGGSSPAWNPLWIPRPIIEPSKYTRVLDGHLDSTRHSLVCFGPCGTGTSLTHPCAYIASRFIRSLYRLFSIARHILARYRSILHTPGPSPEYSSCQDSTIGTLVVGTYAIITSALPFNSDSWFGSCHTVFRLPTDTVANYDPWSAVCKSQSPSP